MNDLAIFQLVGASAPQPDKVLFIFLGDDGTEEIVTWGLLYENVNRCARILKKCGVEKGDCFALFMKNHPEFLYALFAALSLGAVAVPIDPRSKGRKLSFQMQNTRAKAILLTDDLLPAFKEVKAEIPGVKVAGVAYKKWHGIPVDPAYPSLNDLLASESGAQLTGLPPLDFAAPVQIIHTSGTTGDPKGVVLKADRFMVYGFMASLIWNYQPDDVLYTGLSMTHGNAQSATILPAMAKNITAVISERFTKSRLWDICRKYGVTSFSLLGGMMSGIYNEPVRPDDAANPVRRVISAGTPRAIWEDFAKRFDVAIHEWYGAVEGGLAHNPPGTGPVGSFGKPPSDMLEMKIVDEADNEVPAGVKGELISRMKSGATEVAYYGKEKESAEKTRGGWLRSGDICHTDADGFFYFDFRKGGGLRRHGDFIQPDYVEKMIGEDESVSEVVVYGIPSRAGAPGESDLVAAVAPFPGQAVNVESVKRRCMEKLERNSVPSWLQIVPEIPKTVSEKPLDRLLRDAFSPTAENVVAL
ncbi:MAG: AMP-binding protein [Deltaproteobacteria bacterium]|nr:AMP-binding protein [Deltaproteobacteria bacterium]